MPGVLLHCSTCQAHRGTSLAGVLLYSSVHQSLKGAPWVWSYSVFQCVRHLMDQPLCCSVADAGLWGPWQCQVCRDTDCLPCRSYSPIRVFFLASGSRRSKGLFGQSFSIAQPIQTLRGLPCLGSFSVVWCIRHLEGPPWVGSYSVDQGISHLKEHPGWGPTL